MNIKPLIEKQEAEIQSKLDQVHQITERTLGENGRAFTQKEQEEIADLQKQVEGIRSSIKLLKDVYGEGASQSRTRSGDAVGRGETKTEGKDSEEVREKKARDEYRACYRDFVRYGLPSLRKEQQEILQRGISNLSENEMRALSTQVGSQGGFLVPEEFMTQIVENMKAYSSLFDAGITVYPTASGGTINWPMVNDVNNEGAVVAENADVGTAIDPPFSSFSLKEHTYTSRVIRVPNNILQDALTNVEALLSKLISARLGRIINKHLTIGDGAGKPFGIVTRAGVGTSAASATGIAANDFANLEDALDPAYAPNASWMISRGAFSLARKLTDSSGRPLWMPAMSATFANGAPGTINGKPYFVNTHMAAPASGAKSVLFGDFSYYIYRTVGGMTLIRMTERYADFNQTGFVAFMRADGNMPNAGTPPIVALTH